MTCKLYSQTSLQLATLGTEESGRYARCEGGDSADLATERERHLTTARANQTTGLNNG